MKSIWISVFCSLARFPNLTEKCHRTTNEFKQRGWIKRKVVASRKQFCQTLIIIKAGWYEWKINFNIRAFVEILSAHLFAKHPSDSLDKEQILQVWMSFGYYKRLAIWKVIEIKMITLWHHHTDAWHTFMAKNPIILSFSWIKRNENTKSHIIITAKHKIVYDIISPVLVRRIAKSQIICQFSWYIQSHSERAL